MQKNTETGWVQLFQLEGKVPGDAKFNATGVQLVSADLSLGMVVGSDSPMAGSSAILSDMAKDA